MLALALLWVWVPRNPVTKFCSLHGLLNLPFNLLYLRYMLLQHSGPLTTARAALACGEHSTRRDAVLAGSCP